MTGLCVEVFAVAFLTASLTSCVSLDLFGGNSVDSTITTGSVSNRPNTASMSDDMTVRNAVSSADLSRMNNVALPWANTATGSAGVVNKIEEVSARGVTCRNFETTRHAYNGIANFEGQTCRVGTGEWLITKFSEK